MPAVLPIPPRFNGPNVFSINGNGNIVLTDSQNGAILLHQRNTNTLNQLEMVQRFFADAVKDSQADYKLTDVIRILQTCFNNNVAIPANIADYKRTLQGFDQRVLHAYSDNTTTLRNVVKLSTVGGNFGISDAQYSLWESGFGSRSVCRNPRMQTVKTPPATLDSLLKQSYDLLFNPHVTFDQSFSTRLGIPDGFKWSSRPQLGNGNEQKSYVTIDFWTPPPPGVPDAAAHREGVIDNQLNTPVGRGNFNGIGERNNGDVMGNDPKNREIDRLAQQNINNNTPRIKRLFIMKEIGDVLQVWIYLALIIMLGWNEVDVVMVTTDSVVYLFCILLGLSCIYTGERVGVRPGCCTLRHYLAGQPNYLKKYENMIEVYATRLIQHNTSTSMGLLRLIAVPSDFDYYKTHTGNPGYRRTIASMGLTSNLQLTRVNPLIRRFILIIDTSTERVKLALKLVKTDIALRNGGLNAQIEYDSAIDEMRRAQQETLASAIELDQTDHVDVQNAVAAVRAAAATALITAAALLNAVILNTAAVAAAAAGAAAETAINDGYMHFCSVVDPLKQENMLTLLPNKRYIMLPGTLLNAFVNFINPPPNNVTLIPDVSHIIAGAAVAADAQRQFSRLLRGGGGGRGQRGGDPKKQNIGIVAPPHPPPIPPLVQDQNAIDIANEDTSTYNECLVACYIQATRPQYVDLHTLNDDLTLKDNRSCSIAYFDNLIGHQVLVNNTFDFDTLYNQCVLQGPDSNQPNQPNRRVNDAYGDINNELQIAFALDYDKFANALIREQNLEFDETHGCVGRTPNRKLLEDYFDSLSSHQNPINHISRSEILGRGKQLLRLLHLAQDITDEVSSLNSTINERLKIFHPGSNNWIANVNIRYSIYPNHLGGNDWIIDTRFHSWLLRNRRQDIVFSNVQSFNPSTPCGRRRDPISYSLIDPALAIEITITPVGGGGPIRKCYQITTIVDYLMKSNYTLDTLTDLSTTNQISDADKQNIANFIIMMYKLTPIVQQKLGRFLQQPIILLLNMYNQEMAQPAAAAAVGAPAPGVAAVGAPAPGVAAVKRRRGGGGETKRKTIKRKLHYKNKSKNQKIVNKHRMTRRNNIKTRRRTRKHRN
jgi:hypothetical protein